MSNEPQEARYLPQVVFDYKGNPLIEALPPIYSTYEAAKLLTIDPGCHEGERELDEQYRKHCISWEIMLRAMWKNQWTHKQTPLTDELKNVLYDESQGIIDIAVKLYALAQIKAIADGTEMITAKSIREVAAEKLRLVQGALDALRTGDVKKLAQYGDIMPITVDDYFAAQSSRIPDNLPWSKSDALSLEEQAVLKLLEMDIPSKAARSAVRKAIGNAATGQPLSGLIRKAFKIALNMEEKATTEPKVELDEDLRRALNNNAYDVLKNSGSIVETADEF